MITIRKESGADGCIYEIDDFAAYRRALREGGINVPETNYRIVISREHEMILRESLGDWEQHIKRFYQLGPATNILCEIVSTSQSDGTSNH